MLYVCFKLVNTLYLMKHFSFMLHIFILIFLGVTEENPNAVVIGLSPKDFDYSPMNKAFRYCTLVLGTICCLV